MSEIWYPESDLTPPPEFKAGAKPRTDYPGQYCGFAREHIDVIPMEEWPALIEKGISMMPNSHEVYSQDGVGSCGSEGACGALEIMRDAAGLPYVRFNPWFVYHFVSGGVDNGSTLTDNLRFLRDRGACPADIWPRSKGWRAKPTMKAVEAAKQYRIDEYFEIENWLEYGSALLQGYAVYSAMQGHAWVAVELLNTRQIRWRNSWGKDWGDNGYGVLDSSKIAFTYGVFAIRTPVIEQGQPNG